MKRIISLVLTALLALCMPAMAEVTIDDIEAAQNANVHESVRLHVDADFTMSMILGGEPRELPVGVSMDIQFKGERSHCSASMNIGMPGMDRIAFDVYIDGTDLSVYADGRELESVQLTQPINQAGPFTFPEGAQLVEHGDSYAVIVSFDQLTGGGVIDALEFTPIRIEGTITYLFDADLQSQSVQVEIADMSFGILDAYYALSGNMVMTRTGYDDVTDAELAPPAPGAGRDSGGLAA